MSSEDNNNLRTPLVAADFEHRILIRNRGKLFPENGRRRTASQSTPSYGGESTQNVPGLMTNEGCVIALSVTLDNPLGSSGVDVELLTIGDLNNQFLQVYLDSSTAYLTLGNAPTGEYAELFVPFASIHLSHRTPVRLAVGVRLHDANRTLCLWANGRLVDVKGKDGYSSLPATWTTNTQMRIVNRGGIRIVSPQVAYYRGAPEARGSNR